MPARPGRRERTDSASRRAVSAPPPWSLQDFLPCLDSWAEQEHPDDELRLRVLDWIFTRMRDPYADARRVSGFADYWETVIPDSDHFDDHAERCAVIGLYWVDPSDRNVRCDRIASLSLPL